MKAILQHNMSLILIGSSFDGRLDVVWLFHGQDAFTNIQAFDDSLQVSPRLHLSTSLAAAKPFTQFITKPEYRFDIGKSRSECKRLLARKVEIVRTGHLNTLEFLNEDDSQVPGCNHRVEQAAFVLTREACASIGAMVTRIVNDGYGSVDFRVNPDSFNARLQDKVESNDSCGLRPQGRHPYNPDSVDILQITNITTKMISLLSSGGLWKELSAGMQQRI